MQPEAIVFDLDGTLIDSAADIQDALNIVLARSGYAALELAAVRLMIGGGPELLVRRALDALRIESTPAHILELSAEFETTYLERGSPKTDINPGALDLLTFLANRQVPMGICSNKPENICQASLAELEMQHFFAAVRGSGTGLPIKPDPAILLAVIDVLGCDASSAIYVGDSATDVATGRSAGVATALVKSGYSDKPAEQLGADWVVDDLGQVPAIWNKAVA